MFYDLYDIYILIIYYSKYTGSKIDKNRQKSTKIVVLSTDYLLVINSIKLLIFSSDNLFVFLTNYLETSIDKILLSVLFFLRIMIHVAIEVPKINLMVIK